MDLFDGPMPTGEPQGPERPLLYMFQHVALREAAFENHPELIRELEEADPGDRPLLCEWLRDGSHLNYGEGPEPTMDAFVEAVFERVSGGGNGRA